MKIRIQKIDTSKGEIYRVGIVDGMLRHVWLDDEAHSGMGEVEASVRAGALRSVTGWPVELEYELD